MKSQQNEARTYVVREYSISKSWEPSFTVMKSQQNVATYERWDLLVRYMREMNAKLRKSMDSERPLEIR